MNEKDYLPVLIMILLMAQEEVTRDVLEYAKKARNTPELRREIRKLKAIDERFKKQCFDALKLHAITCLN